MRADLHIHSMYSDGVATPFELVSAASHLGLSVIALTDHDCTTGVEPALLAARDWDVEVIPAVEVTCEWPSYGWPQWGGVDILGYFIDHSSASWRKFERRLRQDLEQRVLDCCLALRQRNLPVNPMSLLEGIAYPDAPAIAKHLVAQSLLSSYREAVKVVLDAWNESHVCGTDVGTAIGAIREAGGVAVLAHPAVIRGPQGELTAEDVRRLQLLGLGGVEVFHHSLKDSAREAWLGIAADLGLVVTGGSDEHRGPSEFTRLGTESVSISLVDALRNARLKR